MDKEELRMWAYEKAMLEYSNPTIIKRFETKTEERAEEIYRYVRFGVEDKTPKEYD